MKLTLENKLFFAQVEQLLSSAQYVTLSVRGYSMRPLLDDGRDKVVIRKAAKEDIKVGNILFFHYGEVWYMHRLRRIEGDRLIFEGDGNYHLSECVGEEAVKAIVVEVIRESGRHIRCDSRWWRFSSWLWLVQPPLMRRYALAVMRRINWFS